MCGYSYMLVESQSLSIIIRVNTLRSMGHSSQSNFLPSFHAIFYAFAKCMGVLQGASHKGRNLICLQCSAD